eukprot:TRINITY_DN6698_c0_g2_i4.p1 TRINITY_DN6698_c0_g2~~TRINITY_DN6698_c0_g2_i4.p1  ORF type:complete len:166 (-),score=23.61 TRINITY_DN6698_c0_g2_i4:157-588(-)
MHPIGLIPFAVDLAFIAFFCYFLISEREKPYSPAETSLDSIFSCSTLYMTGFAIMMAFFFDALLYFLALIQQQVWKQYKRRLILWTIFFFVLWGGEIFLLVKIKGCKSVIPKTYLMLFIFALYPAAALVVTPILCCCVRRKSS